MIASETGGLVIDPLSCGDGSPKRFEGFCRALARILQLAGLGQRIGERLHTCLRCGGLVGIQDRVELLLCTVDGFLTAIAVVGDLLRGVDLPLKKGSGLVLHRARISLSLLGLGDRRIQSAEVGFVGLAAQVQGDSVLDGLGMLINLGLRTRKGLVDVVDVIRLAHQLERGPRQVGLAFILLNGFCLFQRGIELRIVGCVGRALLEEAVVRGAELRQLRRVLLVLVLYAVAVGVGHPVIQLSRIADAFKHPFSGAGRVVSYVTAHLHRVLRGRLIVAGIPFNSTDQARLHFFIRVGTNVVMGIDFHGEGPVLLQRVQRAVHIERAFSADGGSSSACIDQLLVQIGILLPYL